MLDFWDWLRYDITCLEANSKRQYDMREWLSWWSATLPRSRPRVRVPSRAFSCKRISIRISFLHEMSPAGLKQNSENSVRGLRGPKVLFGRCYHWSPGPIAPSRAFFMQRDIRKDILFLHEKSTKRDKCCMQYFFGYYFMNRIFFAILLRIREK